MPLKKAELIILKRYRAQESGLYLICLTREFGKRQLVARGAVKPGSVLAEALQYFVVADVVFYQHEKKSADYISRAEVSESFANITGDELKYGYASAGLEFVNLFLPDAEPNQQVYFTLKKYLRLLDRSPSGNFRRELLHFWYLLCIFAGYAPELARCVECGKAVSGNQLRFSPERGGLLCDHCVGDALTLRLERGTLKVLELLAGTDISDGRKVALSAAQEEQIRDLLRALTEHHVGRRVDLKSFTFLRKLQLFASDGGESGKDS